MRSLGLILHAALLFIHEKKRPQGKEKHDAGEIDF
jgi:hypothetical protein